MKPAMTAAAMIAAAGASGSHQGKRSSSDFKAELMLLQAPDKLEPSPDNHPVGQAASTMVSTAHVSSTALPSHMLPVLALGSSCTWRAEGR